MSNLYETLATEIAQTIESGLYQPGEKMPGIRATSSNKSVSASTAVAAYRQLEMDGYIESRPRSGFYVRLRKQTKFDEPEAVVLEKSRPSLVEGQERVLTLVEQINKPGIIKFGAAVPEAFYLPTRQLEKTLTSVARNERNAISLYEEPLGAASLRQQLARRMAQIGCLTRKEDIIVTSGCQEAVFLALKAVCEPGDVVAVESPTYHGHLQVIEALGLKALEIPTDPRAGISIEALQLALEQWPVKACIVIPNFSNPLGSCMSDANKAKLAKLTAKYDVVAIEDDIYGDLSFRHTRPSTLKSFDVTGNIVYCSSFSKTIAPGLRVGWVVTSRYQKQIEYQKYITNVSTAKLPQLVLGKMLESGHYEKHLRFIRSELAKSVSRISEKICQSFPSDTRITKPEGGYVIWVELPEQVDALKVAEESLKQGISIAPGPMFSATPKYFNFMRLSCAVAWEPRTEAAIVSLGGIVKGMLEWNKQ